MVKLCECGCGQAVRANHRRFLNGHNLRMKEHRVIVGASVSRANTQRKGWRHTEEAKKKIGLAHSGEKNPSWVSDYRKLTYWAIHDWVKKHKVKTGRCQHCGKRPHPFPVGRGRMHPGTEFANISGEYRRDIDDYIELCRPCHIKFDQ